VQSGLNSHCIEILPLCDRVPFITKVELLYLLKFMFKRQSIFIIGWLTGRYIW